MKTLEKIQPILLESEDTIIHPLRNLDMGRLDQITNDLFELFSDSLVFKYSPEKKVVSIKEANDAVFGIITGYNHGTYAHFITYKKNLEVIGVFYLVSPSLAQSKYSSIPTSTWLIEYYLKPKYWGMSIIPNVLTAVLNKMITQSITKFGAIVFRDNLNSIKVLDKLNFKFYAKFDFYQDLYLMTINV